MEFTSEFKLDVTRNSPDDTFDILGIMRFPTLVVMLVMIETLAKWK